MASAKISPCVIKEYNASIRIHNKYMKTVNLLSELLFNKRKRGPRVVESFALEHTAPFLALASGMAWGRLRTPSPGRCIH